MLTLMEKTCGILKVDIQNQEQMEYGEMEENLLVEEVAEVEEMVEADMVEKPAEPEELELEELELEDMADIIQLLTFAWLLNFNL